MGIWTILIALGSFATLIAAYLVYRNLMIWQPVQARRTGTDYREASRNFDNIGVIYSGALGEIDLLGRDDNLRATENWYRYEDAAGVTHTVQLTEYVQRGHAPDSVRLLWIDPENPERVTRFGPGLWLLTAVALAGATAWLTFKGPTAFATLLV